jgi:hypothetical protein
MSRGHVLEKVPPGENQPMSFGGKKRRMRKREEM